MTLLILIVSLLFVHSGDNRKIEPEALPYVSKFIDIANKYNVEIDKDKIEIKFSYFVLEYPTLGTCFSTGEILINHVFWNIASTTQKEILIFHELGHCSMKLDHVDSDDDIMTAYQIDSYYYKRDYNKMLNRFFNCKDNCPVIDYVPEE
jgi:hypothetical protein